MSLELGFSAFHQDNEQTNQMSLYVPEEDKKNFGQMLPLNKDKHNKQSRI